ncbi:MAG: hypothetical protein AABW50_03750 [Nanoarchaeota archaeon]
MEEKESNLVAIFDIEFPLNCLVDESSLNNTMAEELYYSMSEFPEMPCYETNISLDILNNNFYK